jgi:hypothetical protein
MTLVVRLHQKPVVVLRSDVARHLKYKASHEGRVVITMGIVRDKLGC